MHLADRGGDQTILHDLNFLKTKYEVLHTLSFPTNKPNLLRLLEASGPVGGASTTAAAAGSANSLSSTPAKQDSKSAVGAASADNKRKQLDGGDSNPKVKKSKKVFEKGSVDLERLAEGLQQLSEDDLLGVVQMVTDNKTSDMYVKNDIDEGEFHMDLYTLPDSLLRSLWDYVKKRADV